MIGKLSFGLFEKKAPVLAAAQAGCRPAHSRMSRLYLGKGRVVRIEPTPDPLRIECRHGRLWVTQSGLAQDRILQPGDSFQARQQGRVVIEALENACVAQTTDSDDSGVVVSHE